MIDLLHQSEDEPSPWPDPPEGLSTEADALDEALLWQRIEDFIAYRWGERGVVWIVRGWGDWLPPLTPYTVDTTERWTGTQYESISLAQGPVGLNLEGDTYRITATVGSSEVPPVAVLEAYARLAEYLAEDRQMGLVNTTHTVGIADAISTNQRRPRDWHSNALILSGAADLLRRYRRA